LLTDSSGSEAEQLLSYVLSCSRAQLYDGGFASLSPEQAEAFRTCVHRRKQLEPIQYITGRQAFRYLELAVGPGVLIPRPETEMVVERCLHLLKGLTSPTIADLGTGSAAIALAIADERPDAEVWATEISEPALYWARLNRERHRHCSRLTILKGDLFEPLSSSLQGRLDLVVSNPPYLCAEELDRSPADVKNHEPHLALFGGSDGLEVARRIVQEAPLWLSSGGRLVMETSERAAFELADLMRIHFREIAVSNDLTGRARIAEGRKP